MLFSVASTLGITVRQREVEIGLLRTVGATPRQARRLVRAETLARRGRRRRRSARPSSPWAAGALLAPCCATAAWSPTRVDYGAGPARSAATALLVVLTSLVAAAIAARRATRGPATVALAEGRAGTGRMPWWRVAARRCS